MQSGQTAGGTEGKCSVILNTNGSPLWEWGAAGLVLRQNCGNGVEVRYFHLHQFQGDTQLAVTNNTGSSSGPHLHYEVYIDNQAVDPECVLGIEKTDSRSMPCPPGIGPGPANLCDGNQREALKSKSVKATNTTIAPGTCAVPTNRYGNPGELPDQPPPPPGHEGEGPYPDTPPTTIGTGITIGTGPMEPGDPGGEITPGTDHPPGEIPPLHDGDGKENEQTSCAVDTWVAMTNQSVMEARRETAMQRRFIAKADSVIEYGCMAKYLKKTETDVAAIFSESDQWVNRPVDLIGRVHVMNKTLGAQSMDSALINVVWAAHEAYKQNFSHALMGGLEGYSEQPNGEACADMQKVWDAAKCQNFPGASEAFPRFTDLIDNDPRKFPSATCNNTGIHDYMINAAKNKATRYDAVNPKFEYVAPLDEKSGDCARPVPTGVMVYETVRPDPDSTDFKFGKMMKNLGERGYVTMDELEEAFPDKEEREIIIKRLQEAGVKILPAGTKVPEGEKMGDLLAGNDFIGDMKVYSDAVCPNPGCHYSNPDKEGLGKCTFPAPEDEKDK